MTQTDLLQALTVERYQPRHLAKDNGSMPPVLTFDEFVASLRAEARRDVPSYAPTPLERRKRQEQDAQAFIEANRIDALIEERRLARERRRLDAQREEQARRRKQERQASDLKVEKVSEALSSGMTLREAIIQAQRGTMNG